MKASNQEPGHRMAPTRVTAMTTRPSTHPAFARKHGEGPTPRQRAIWEFMVSFQRAHCMPPTHREICDRFGLSSTQGSVAHLKALVKKGWVMRICVKGRSRGYLAVFRDDRCPCCGRIPLGQSEFSRKVGEPGGAKLIDVAALEESSPITSVPSMSPRCVNSGKDEG